MTAFVEVLIDGRVYSCKIKIRFCTLQDKILDFTLRCHLIPMFDVHP